MTPRATNIILHATGGNGFRNHYVITSKSGDIINELMAMEAAGYLTSRPDKFNPAATVYHATYAGCIEVGLTPYEAARATGDKG